MTKLKRNVKLFFDMDGIEYQGVLRALDHYVDPEHFSRIGATNLGDYDKILEMFAAKHRAFHFRLKISRFLHVVV